MEHNHFHCTSYWRIKDQSRWVRIVGRYVRILPDIARYADVLSSAWGRPPIPPQKSLLKHVRFDLPSPSLFAHNWCAQLQRNPTREIVIGSSHLAKTSLHQGIKKRGWIASWVGDMFRIPWNMLLKQQVITYNPHAIYHLLAKPIKNLNILETRATIAVWCNVS